MEEHKLKEDLLNSIIVFLLKDDKQKSLIKIKRETKEKKIVMYAKIPQKA